MKGAESDEELDHSFSGKVTYNMSVTDTKAWTVDSGTSDHMTALLEDLMNVRKAPPNLIIKLPTGDTTVITHIGDVKLDNNLILHNMLYVPQFQHNLLSIHKLQADNNCVIHFSPGNCKIVDNTSKTVRAMSQFKMV